MWQVTHQYRVSCLLKLHRIVCKIKRWKLFDPFMDLHRSYTNVNVTWVKGRIQKFMGVWELENQIDFSIKCSVYSHLNLALEQPKHPKKCIRIDLLFAWNPFSAGGLRPPGPPTRALPWTHWGPKRPPDPSPIVIPHCSRPSYAPAKISHDHTVSIWMCITCTCNDVLKTSVG